METPLDTRPRRDPRQLAAFVRSKRGEIVAEWERVVRAMPVARSLDRVALVDHVPQLLARIADLIERVGDPNARAQAEHESESHALDRLDAGFDLGQVVTELAALRDCIAALWDVEVQGRPHMSELRVLNQALDRAVASSVEQYLLARDRTLAALDRISSAAFEATDLPALLHALLSAILETAPAIDTAAILLREGELLRVRASIGLEREVDDGFTLHVGEGIAGMIAATGEPLAIREPSSSPLLKSRALRERHLRTLYGVPLIHEGHVIGVAHVGSLTAHELSSQDRALFDALAHRATAAIALHMLREAAERRAEDVRLARQQAQRASASLDALFESTLVGIGFLDAELRYIRVNDALAAINGRAATEHEGRSLGDVLGRETAELVEPVLRRVIESGEPARNVEVTGRLPSAPGVPRTFLATFFAVRTPTGERLGVGSAVIEITDRKRIEDALRLSEGRLQSILQNAPVAISVKDVEGRCLLANPRKCAIVGRPESEVVGRTDHDVLGKETADRMRDEDERFLAGGAAPTETEERIVLPDGEHTYLTTRFPVPGPGGGTLIGGIATDITERKRTELEQSFLARATAVLAQSLEPDATLRQIAELAVPTIADWCTVGVFDRGDPSGPLRRVAIVHPDPTMIPLLEDLARRHSDTHEVRGARAVAMSGRPQLVPLLGEETMRAAAQDAEHLEKMRQLALRSLIIVPLSARGQSLGAITLAMDASSTRGYDERDLELAMELARRAAVAIDNARLYEGALLESRMREDVLAVVSHDLRNALHAIRGSTAVLLHDRRGERDRKLLDVIHRGSVRMEHLIRDLLDVASIQKQRLAVDVRPESVRPLLTDACESHQPAARQKGVDLSVAVDETEDARAACDSQRIQQVLANLLGNATKFCKEGDSIRLRAWPDGERVVFEVADTGPGIAPGELPHIFDPYWSAPRHAARGTGLGLFISRGIVEAHGGRIWAESELGAGSTFRFTLPLARAD
ncbi:MAG: PAS domain-containing protein [Myxococcota bacterium]|nr:PAS domain-containing protein [Myxococcota bacterium]